MPTNTPVTDFRGQGSVITKARLKKMWVGVWRVDLEGGGGRGVSRWGTFSCFVGERLKRKGGPARRRLKRRGGLFDRSLVPRKTFQTVKWSPRRRYHRLKRPPGIVSRWGTIWDTTPSPQINTPHPHPQFLRSCDRDHKTVTAEVTRASQ